MTSRVTHYISAPRVDMTGSTGIHTSYQPLKPATNKLLKKKWDTDAQNEHRRKVSGAKPVVDTNSPRTYAHLQYKMKKVQVRYLATHPLTPPVIPSKTSSCPLVT